jgi:hypothetical protein
MMVSWILSVSSLRLGAEILPCIFFNNPFFSFYSTFPSINLLFYSRRSAPPQVGVDDYVHMFDEDSIEQPGVFGRFICFYFFFSGFLYFYFFFSSFLDTAATPHSL